MRDFTFHTYRYLLQTLQETCSPFYTFEDWCEKKPKGDLIILRHDIDLKAKNALLTARIEHELGIRASYYFRVVPQSNQPEIICTIRDLGHEIGYHYEDLTIADGDVEEAINHFGKWLSYFRQYYPVKTVCMHGSPRSRFDNRDIWKFKNYQDYDIIGEPYFDFLASSAELRHYFTDTGRMWDGDRYNIRDRRIDPYLAQEPDIHTTFDFIRWLKTSQDHPQMMITTHPQLWNDQYVHWIMELCSRYFRNRMKRYFFK